LEQALKEVDLSEREDYNLDEDFYNLPEFTYYNSLKNFWYWCCLNPRAEVADSLFEFLQNNTFRINKQGFFFALRNVVTVKGKDTELVKFVSEQYNKIKGIWKKNPANFEVWQASTGEYKIKDNQQFLSNSDFSLQIGNLKDLYLDLPNLTENRYTDHYTGTFYIRIGQKVSMPKEECN